MKKLLLPFLTLLILSGCLQSKPEEIVLPPLDSYSFVIPESALDSFNEKSAKGGAWLRRCTSDDQIIFTTSYGDGYVTFVEYFDDKGQPLGEYVFSCIVPEGGFNPPVDTTNYECTLLANSTEIPNSYLQ